MAKVYSILLENKRIGMTRLEMGDAAMGVVFGEIEFTEIKTPYDFFKSHCQTNNLQFTDYPDDKNISIQTILTLKITDNNGNEVKGIGNNIFASNSDPCEITIEGIAYPFYGEEFPHHVKAYEERFR